jgi:predicted phage terminase large subunit-like protein
MHLTPEEYRTLLRQDLSPFIHKSFSELNPQTKFLPNWHNEVIAAELEKCRRGETKRLIINLPPRSLKSHCASIAFPAFLLGHNPAAQIICASYGQDLADKLAADSRSVMTSAWYRNLFPGTQLAPRRQALNDFATSQQGFRLSTSVGGGLLGRGADFIIIDDPLKPEEALSEVQRRAVNDWYDRSLVTRLNNKRTGCIILIMQRLHEDDLVGHVQTIENWRVLKFPAIAEENESYTIQTPSGRPRNYERKAGEPLHPAREPLEVLDRVRRVLGEYNFAGQYQQAPSPLEGGIVKASWFKRYTDADRPEHFDMVYQSWDTANKAAELNDYSVCTTWGVKGKRVYLLHVFRKRLSYPELKRAVREQAEAFNPKVILIEDKASGTQLIQELVSEGMHPVKKYEPSMEKTMRMNSVTSTIENGFVFLPDQAPWLGEYLHELAIFPNGKYDDQADSTSQGLDWFKQNCIDPVYGLLEYYKREAEKAGEAENIVVEPPVTRAILLGRLDPI